jgi:hypothetical protein
MKKVIGLFAVIGLIAVACATVPPDTGQIELHKTDIRTIAILPLVMGDGEQKVRVGLGGESEVGGSWRTGKRISTPLSSPG